MLTQELSSLPRSGLVGEYLFDGNPNDTNDGTKYNGTATNVSYASCPRGYVKQCASVSSGNGKVTMATDSSASWSISLYVNVTSFSAQSYGKIYDQSENDGGFARFSIQVGPSGSPSFLYTMNNGSGDQSITASGQSNATWNHLFVTYDGASKVATMWQNNVYVGTFTLSGTVRTGPYRSCFAVNNGGNPLNAGQLSSVRHYNRVLIEAERLALWHEFHRKLGGGSDFGAFVPAPQFQIEYDGSWQDVSNSVEASSDSSVSASDSFGISGKAADFNGSSQRTQFSDTGNFHDFSGPFSIEWFGQIDALPTSGNLASLFNKYDQGANAGGYECQLYNNAGTQQVFFGVSNGSSGGYPGGNYTLPTGTPSHLLFTHDNAISRIYLNGVEILNGANARTVAANSKLLNLMNFGYYTPSSGEFGRYADGKVYRLAGYASALDANQAKFIFSQTSSRYPYAFRRSIPQNLVAKAKFYAPDGRYNIAQTGYDLSPVGSPTTTRAQQNKCVSTAATGDYLANSADIPSCDIAAGNAYTLACWLKSSDITGVAYYLLAGDATTPLSLSIFLLSGVIQVDWSRSNVADDLTSTGLAPDGKWHHVAATFSGGVTKVYLDGHLQATGSYTDGNGTGSPSITGISVARGFDSSTQVSDPFVTNSALSHEEIQRMFFSTYRN